MVPLREECAETDLDITKAKLKTETIEVIEQDVQHELEEMEKETDIDDILDYRSVAERELEDFLVNPSLRYGSNSGNVDKSVEDDRPPSKAVDDDVIKDIYEATKFHPASELVGDSTTMVEFYFSSMKINISETHTTLRSTTLEMGYPDLRVSSVGELGHAIADLMLKGISIEGKVWEKSAIISASVNGTDD
ncbi:hypothetical protein Sango_1064000 [Sesamum angolense]|uniref:Uncharacterized protein n=1 Tax=Sesamum angolense TaxID=2727404 RepID=A0AAE2BZ86_9LAMI|nr:hypothetical protein Sango_1064000 [Sesamum angolense]